MMRDCRCEGLTLAACAEHTAARLASTCLLGAPGISAATMRRDACREVRLLATGRAWNNNARCIVVNSRPARSRICCVCILYPEARQHPHLGGRHQRSLHHGYFDDLYPVSNAANEGDIVRFPPVCHHKLILWAPYLRTHAA